MEIETIQMEKQTAIALKYENVSFSAPDAEHSQIATVMAEGYGKLWGYLGQNGKRPADAPYCKYTNGSADFMRFDLELGIPVSEPLPENGGMYMTETDSGKAVSAVHKGAYKDVEQTYAPMLAYVSENNLESKGVYYDFYLNSPADVPENELLTKVVFPIK